MSFLHRTLGKVFAGRKRPRGNRKVVSRKQERRLTMEHMEQRMMFSGLSLTATPYSATQINLAWTDSSPVTRYVVEEWIPGDTVELPNGSVKQTRGAWTQLPAPANGSTSDAVPGLEYDTSYTFRVGAENAAGTTWSNSASAMTGILVDHPAASTAYTNVSGTLWGPTNEPSYLDVRQGTQGDCGLMASLAEVAYRDPQDIKNMFTPYGTTVENGTTVNLYTVRFFTSRETAEYVTVDTELPAGGGTYDHPVNGVLWAALAEKAYAQAYGAGYVSVAVQSNPPPKDSYASLVMWPSTALQAITGNNQGDASIDPSKIPAAWKANDFVVLTTSANAASSYIVGDTLQTSSGPLPETHCYAVISSPSTYTASSAKAAASPVANYNTSATTATLPFEVYNPWGTDSSGWALSTFHGKQVYGLFTANANFLSSNFAQQSFATPSAAGDETGGFETKRHLAIEAATDLVLAGWGT
jgi:hypothetical protein